MIELPVIRENRIRLTGKLSIKYREGVSRVKHPPSFYGNLDLVSYIALYLPIIRLVTSPEINSLSSGDPP
jgi:hypothetical protein